MFKKKNSDRRKKRMVKKLLIFSSVVIGVGVLAGFGIYALILVKLQEPAYISPLARIATAQASQSKIDILKSELQKQNLEYSSVQVEKDGSFIVKLKQGGAVTFSSQKDIITQIASLQYILSHLTMEGKLFTRLDLRFEKPVIVLKK
jgi:hypothetical protein